MKNKNALKRVEELKKETYPYEMEQMGTRLIIEKNVYPTSEIAEHLIKSMNILEKENITNKNILDYGTGCGFLAIQAAKKGAEVIALDKNPYAIECARKNAERNHVKVEFRLSDCLSAIKDEKFDIILAGMPWDNDIPDNYIEMALFDKNGEMKKTLFKNANKLLNKNGYILMTYAKFMMDFQPIKDLIGSNIEYEIVSRPIIDHDEHYIIKLWNKEA